jgi:hypothetical protein
MRSMLIALLCLAGPVAFAQQAAPSPADGQPAQETNAGTMEEPRAGDHWTYEIRDEISGAVTSTRTDTITEVSLNQIGVKYSTEKGQTGFNVFDRSWNMKSTDVMKYEPHSGLGYLEPLKVGTARDFKVDQTNTEKGITWKWIGRSKVSAQEQITTKAGTFDAFKIETNYTFYPVNNPVRKSETVMQTWYAPTIDHWVRRTVTTRSEKLLRTNQTIELVAYGRKE